MGELQNFWNKIRNNLRRSKEISGSQTILARDAFAFHAYRDDNVSMCSDNRQKTSYFSNYEVKPNQYYRYEDQNKEACDTYEPNIQPKCKIPNIATILLTIMLLLIFIGLPFVYLLNCFDVISAHWAAEEHNNGLFQTHHKSLNALKHEIHDSHESELHKKAGTKSNGFKISGGENNHGLPNPIHASPEQCSKINYFNRFDCFPEPYANQQLCEARGCCWVPRRNNKKYIKDVKKKIDVPYCFYPSEYGGYRVIDIAERGFGLEVHLNRTFKSPYPNDVPTIVMTVKFETDQRLHIKISDQFQNRYQPLYPEVPILDVKSKNPDYSFQIDDSKTGFKVVRNSDSQVIFDAQNVGALIFADQFLQISVRLPPKTNIYGLGEHRTSFSLDTNWQSVTMFNADQYPIDNSNLYGSHPFYLAVEPNGISHGVFLLNSNAMEVILQPLPAVTFRTIGGILDFYILLGPTPQDVVSQYTEIVGRPFMPPYWSLGFHLCRYGTRTLNATREVLERNLKAGIPIDVQWNDLDYMKANNDFTYDDKSFNGLPEFIDELHKKGMHWIPIIDAGVSAGEKVGSYPPYDKGIEMDIFVKNSSRQPFIGKVWNRKATVWPDFTNPTTVDYWTEMLQNLHHHVPFDGVWIDMNEPSNFLSGSVDGCPKSNLEDPPYVPPVNGGVLKYKTMCMTSIHYAGDHYNVHNLYGFTEAIVTTFAMAQIRGKRPFVISRSTYLGHGHYAGHWSGDVFSTWHDLKKSVMEILTFNIFGIPMVGADICGFNGNTTVELCARWLQLGAFYPFSRNHNTDDAIAQDPAALGDLTIKSAKKALTIRYSLLPLLYTLFWKSHMDGTTVATPLFFQYPDDYGTYKIEEQFLWGNSLMIIPVLEQGATNVSTYLPKDTWYDFYTSKKINGDRNRVILDAPMDTIPLLIRGGSVIPMQMPNITTTLTRLNPIQLLVALDSDGHAFGELYWDDGDSLNAYSSFYTLINMSVNSNSLVCTPIMNNYNSVPPLNKVTVLGINTPVKIVLVNEKSTEFTYKNNVLEILKINMSMHLVINISWK